MYRAQQLGRKFSLRRLFSEGGYLWGFGHSSLNRQTFDAPATIASAAGDPVGLMLPAQAPEAIVNNLIWTDGFSNAIWTGTATVTANTRNNWEGVPIADTLTAIVTSSSRDQAFTCAADTAVRMAFIDVETGTSTHSELFLIYTGGNTYSVAVTWSGGVPTPTAGNSATASDVGVTLMVTGIYRIWVKGANTNRTTCTLAFRPSSPGSSGTGTVYASSAQVHDGSTMTAYQPNAGCLGGSNRRSGGANQFLWSENVANPAWTKTGTTPSDNGTLTAIAGTSTHLWQQIVASTVSGQQLTCWADIEYSNQRYVQITTANIGGTDRVNYDLVGGTVSAFGSSTGTITSQGGNIWRISYTYTADGASRYPVFGMVTSLSAARAESWLAAGTETVKFIKGWWGYGASLGTYSRNMDQLGGLITNVPLYQTNTSNRLTLARWPAGGIRNLITNNTNVGGVIPTSPGTGWSQYTAGGVTTTTEAFGTVTIGSESVPYVDFRVVCTAGSSAGIAMFLPNSISPIAVSTAHTASCYLQLVSTISGSAPQVRWTIQDGVLTPSGSYFTIPASLTQVSYTHTTSASATLFNALLNINTSAAGCTFIIRVAGFTVERGSSPTALQKTALITDVTESGQPYNYGYYGDGTSDTALTGLQAFGASTLCAQAGNEFTLFGFCRTLSKVRTIGPAQASATAGSKTFQMYANTTTGYLTMNVRGTVSNLTTADLTDGNFHTFCITWDGTTMSVLVDGLAAQTATVGTAAIEAQEIMLWARTLSSPAEFLPGHQGWGFLSRAASVSERAATMANLNATYRPGL